jgi:uncharacterized protein YjdB
MLKTSPLVRVSVLAGVVSLLACGQAPFSIPETEQSSLHISPSGSTIQTGSNLQLRISVAEGSERGVAPTEALWSSSNPNTVAVTTDGVVIGLAVGQADITAEFGGFRAVSRIALRAFGCRFNADSLKGYWVLCTG